MSDDVIPQHMRPRVHVTTENFSPLYHAGAIPYDVANVIKDPCSTFLIGSLAAERNDRSKAAKAERAKLHAARAERLELERSARDGKAVMA
jgi:hypothetical protein